MNIKSHQIFSIILVVCFCGVIIIPLIKANFTPNQISVSENRALANFPSIKNESGQINKQFVSQFETWFNDNLGYRDKFVEYNTLLQYNLFGLLNKSDTLLGKNDWLYYINDDIIKDYQHINLPSNEELELWGNKLEEIESYLKKKNISFYLTLIPDKKTIYPENYTNTILQNGNVSKMDMVTNYLNNHTNVEVINTTNALIKAKDKAVVYSPRVDNGHWNKYGAMVGYHELVSEIKKKHDSVNLLSFYDYDIQTESKEIVINNALKFTEEDYIFVPKYNNNYTNETGQLDAAQLTMANVNFKSSNQLDGPKVVYFGDSYTYGFLFHEYAHTFPNFTFVHLTNLDKLYSFVNLLDPDVVVFEFAERMLDTGMNVLINSKENSIIDESVLNLPQADEFSFYIDYVGTQYSPNQNEIHLNNISQTLVIQGWAVDNKNGKPAHSVYIKVGDKFYSGINGLYHYGVDYTFNNDEIVNSGFALYANSTDLIEAGGFELYFVSADQKNIYKHLVKVTVTQ